MQANGRFIVLEGLDGSGTTTQTNLLAQWFSGEGARYGKCVASFEPTPGPAGSVTRLALNHRLTLDSRTMALLFAADRTDHLFKEGSSQQEPGIFHLLQQGMHVICDRFLLSSLAYQSLTLPMEWILQINAQAIVPDVTIFIDIDPAISMRRLLDNRSHRDLYEAEETQSQVRAQYEKAILLLESEGQRIVRIDGSRSQEEVHHAILVEAQKVLPA